MQQFVKKNLTLILAFLLPLLLIFVVAINAYFPFSFLKTEYNFVYVACDEATDSYPHTCELYAQSLYRVENNKIVKNNIDPQQDSDNNGTPDLQENYPIRIFLHNTSENVSREITFEEAQQKEFNSLLTSPDGVTISSGYSSGSGTLFFDSGSSYGYYLTKGKLRNKLNLINDERYYSRGNFNFIGWVLK